jgi:hypothetical protein
VLTERLRSSYSKVRVGKKLLQLYNLGAFFSVWTDEGPVALVKDIDEPDLDTLGAVRNGALSGLTSIMYSLEDVPELGQLRIIRVLAERPTAELGSAAYLDQAAPYPMLEIELDSPTIAEYLHTLVSAHRFGIDHLLQYAAIVLQTTAEKYAQDLVDTSFFFGFRFELERPELDVEDLGLNYEWDLRPALLDIVKGESVPADVTDGNWQELPNYAP